MSRAVSARSSPVLAAAAPHAAERKPRWREPTRAAVDMSLRAEKESTGGKRRLASDLYKIMMADTEEAGFSLEPTNEDSMDKWRIKLCEFYLKHIETTLCKTNESDALEKSASTTSPTWPGTCRCAATTTWSSK